MLEVSDFYKDKIYTQTGARRFRGRVLFELLDVDAYRHAQVTSEVTAPIGVASQLLDKRRTPAAKYATYEPNYFKLDGSFAIPPRPSESNVKVGWWGEEIGAADGTYTTPQSIEITLAESGNSAGLTIVFNDVTKEYAVDFDVLVDEALYEIRGNGKTTYTLESNMDEYTNVTINILKWSHGYRRVKVMTVDFGIIKSFENTDLINMSVTEEINVIGESLPTNELRFAVDNQDRIYNILNPSGQYRFLMERQEAWATLGLEISPGLYEDINMGKFYLKEWRSDEGALTTTFTALGIFDLMQDVMFDFYDSTNLYDLAEHVFARVQIVDYVIDEGLKQFDTMGFAKAVNCREALYYIAMASMSIARQDREGTVELQQFRVLDVGTSFIHHVGDGMYASDALYPAVNQGYDMKNITFKNVYAEPQIKLAEQVGAVSIIVDNHEAGTQDTYTLSNPKIRYGTTLVHENPLIISEAHAKQVATWLLEESSLRAEYDIHWRQNPALESGDTVLVEDSYNSKKQSRIIKQYFDYQSHLSGRTETRGGV